MQCKNNATHCKFNDICIAWILIHCTNIAIPCKINYICIAFIIFPCKNNATHHQIDDSCTEAPEAPKRAPSCREAKSDKFTSRKVLFLSTSRQPCKIEKSKEARKTPPEIASRPPAHTKEAYNIDTNSFEKQRYSL